MKRREKELTSLRAAALELGVGYSTLRAWVDQGRLPVYVFRKGRPRARSISMEDARKVFEELRAPRGFVD